MGAFRPLQLMDSVSKDVPKEKVILRVNQYLLSAKIGVGGAAKVYLGIDSVNGDEYAVKRINLGNVRRATPGITQLDREIKLLRSLDHPNIMKLREVLHCRERKQAFIVLEFAHKGSTGGLIERGVRLPHPAIFSLIKQVAGALHYIHEQGYVHQDIKPCNIMIDQNGRAILGDFGVGHSFGSSAMVVGTPAYQAPEALDDSEEDLEPLEDGPQREDVWAIGVTLYELLFLKLPFTGENLYEIVCAIKEQPLEIPEGTDPRLEDLLRRLLCIDPRKRMTAEELRQHELIANAPDLAEGIPDPERPTPIRGKEVMPVVAKICPKGHLFAITVASGQRLLSLINAPYSQERFALPCASKASTPGRPRLPTPDSM